MPFLRKIRNIKSGKKELQAFARDMAIILAVVGLFLWWRKRPNYGVFLAIAAAFFLMGRTAPIILKPLQKAWMTLSVLLGLTIGWAMTRMIVGFLFYFVLTPIAVIARWCGQQFLDLKFSDKTCASYWTVRPNAVFDKKRYEKQY